MNIRISDITYRTVESETGVWKHIRGLQELVNHSPVPFDPKGFQRLRESSGNCIFLAAFEPGNIPVGLVQGTRIINMISSKVFVDSMAVREDQQGNGVGRQLLSALENNVLDRWSDVNKIILTNSPKRGNGNFYRSCGFAPRADERPLVRAAKWFSNFFSEQPDETFVWQKSIR